MAGQGSSFIGTPISRRVIFRCDFYCVETVKSPPAIAEESVLLVLLAAVVEGKGCAYSSEA